MIFLWFRVGIILVIYLAIKYFKLQKTDMPDLTWIVFIVEIKQMDWNVWDVKINDIRINVGINYC